MNTNPETGSSSENFFYGWELLYNSVKSDIGKKADLLILLAHFFLTKHHKFRCVGLGTDKCLLEEDTKGSLVELPDRWNWDDTNYALKYMYYKNRYLLLGHITEDALVINLLDTNNSQLTNICIEPELLVMALDGNIFAAMPKAADIIDRYRKELLRPVFSGNSHEVACQTVSIPSRTVDPLREPEPVRPGQFRPRGYEPRPFGFPDIWRNNLEPIALSRHGSFVPLSSQPSLLPKPIQFNNCAEDGQPIDYIELDNYM
ncbi:proteasome inhibitor PI31 subunit-like [Scaptodrosophila lebanonensis]|uniref:Proteasome inhibitor PI31 subunit n=1 Tax=Drosophila lebanonensis TaxID=7225 RepID=A0A6J2TUL4_DROLE|nr:proteasome inhibitor PI31 subunit-like [Scaptodrosophila lebanonensis]